MDRRYAGPPTDQPPDPAKIAEWVRLLPVVSPENDGGIISTREVNLIMHEVEIAGLPLYGHLNDKAAAIIRWAMDNYEVPDASAIVFGRDEFRSIIYHAARSGAAQVIRDIGEGLRQREHMDRDFELMQRNPGSEDDKRD